MATKFFKCAVCGNVIVKFVDSGIIPECCGEEMVELQPDTTDGKVEYHIPVVERMEDSTLKIMVGAEPHPMTEKHHIVFIYAETENGGQIHYLDPTKPAQTVICDCTDKIVAVYAYCNLHGLWKAEFKEEEPDNCSRYEKCCCGSVGPNLKDVKMLLASILYF